MHDPCLPPLDRGMVMVHKTPKQQPFAFAANKLKNKTMKTFFAILAALTTSSVFAKCH
jgi:hypothetical protein